jgi:hypothetical protein
MPRGAFDAAVGGVHRGGMARPPMNLNRDARADSELATPDTRSRADDDLSKAMYDKQTDRAAADAGSGRRPGLVERFRSWLSARR